jgi:hypothetical protein
VHDPLVGSAYYAVFTGGADGWTTSARAPYSADQGTGLPEEEAPEETGGPSDETPVPPSDDACGCGSRRGGAGAFAVALAVAFLRRPRRLG